MFYKDLEKCTTKEYLKMYLLEKFCEEEYIDLSYFNLKYQSYLRDLVGLGMNYFDYIQYDLNQYDLSIEEYYNNYQKLKESFTIDKIVGNYKVLVEKNNKQEEEKYIKDKLIDNKLEDNQKNYDKYKKIYLKENEDYLKKQAVLNNFILDKLNDGMEFYKIYYFRKDMSLDFAQIIYENINGELFAPSNIYNSVLIKNHIDVKEDFTKKFLENEKYKDVFVNENYYTLDLRETKKTNEELVIKQKSFENSIKDKFQEQLNNSYTPNKNMGIAEKNISKKTQQLINEFQDFLLVEVYTRSSFDYNFLEKKIKEKIKILEKQIIANDLHTSENLELYKEALNFIVSIDRQLEFSEKYKHKKNKSYLKDIELQDSIDK